VTDTYGNSRVTGGSNISHKGTDFRAAVGTPIYAMNSGVVRLTRNMRNYGNTIVIDHGLGLHTIYMHLSEISVDLNQRVEKGELIGKSGDTGYVLGPHLHLTIRINGISIDPEKFMAIFGTGQ
jgi:murein DD-endopeptidase MepM/ murein hydrolase activator NlpD